MQMIHFTPGSLDPKNYGRRGVAASLPLSSGSGDHELSALYFAERGQISIAAQPHCQLLLMVNGKAEVRYGNGRLFELYAGVGLLLAKGEGCQLSTMTGALLLTIEGRKIEADPCGISTLERVAHQQWPALLSNWSYSDWWSGARVGGGSVSENRSTAGRVVCLPMARFGRSRAPVRDRFDHLPCSLRGSAHWITRTS